MQTKMSASMLAFFVAPFTKSEGVKIMGKVNVQKRGKVFQYQFEIASVNGKRKFIIFYGLSRKWKWKKVNKEEINNKL